MTKIPDITPTEDSELQTLMAYEFYRESDKKYDPAQLEKYIDRLTRGQKAILGESDLNELTSFVVFGDGFIERKIGGTYVFQDDPDYVRDFITPKINDISTRGGHVRCKNIASITADEAVEDTLNLEIDILPNASFAIFNKISRRQVELLFYTRFFVINYYMLQDCAIVARFFVKQLNTLLEQPSLTAADEIRKEELKEKIRKCMQKIYTVYCSCSRFSSRRDAPEGLEPSLGTKVGLRSQRRFKYYLSNTSIDPGSEIPYISIVDRDRNPIWWMRGGSEWNTIHGTLSTRGCWMIFSNETWNYGTGTDINNENYTYYEFLRLFAGIEYNSKDPTIKFKELKDRDKNAWDPSLPLTWKNNYVGNACGPSKPWSSLFFFNRMDQFTSDSGDGGKFKLD